MGKKRQKKSGTSKKRQRRYHGPGSAEAESEPPESSAGGGVMQGMVGGFRRAVGVEKPKKRGLGDHLWTILLVVALAAVLFWRFGT